MKKKFNFKSFAMGVFVSLFVFTSIGNTSIAKSAKENIQVLYNNIKIVVDNKPVKFGKDSNGNQIEPFIYNGTTYLPVRAVGEALGKDVKWDGENQTVYVGDIEKGKQLMADTIEPHNIIYADIYTSKDSKKLNIAGKDYSTGYKLAWYGASKLNFNLNSQYKEIEFDLGPAGDYDIKKPNNLLIYMDGELKNTYEINGNDGIKSIKIPVTGVNQLRIESSGGSPEIGLGDVFIK